MAVLLLQLCADSDTNTKNGAELLDRLVKDVVIESRTLDMEKFIPLLRERIYARNPFVRQFLVSWVSLLRCQQSGAQSLVLSEALIGLSSFCA